MTDFDLPDLTVKPKFYDLVIVHGKVAHVSGQVSRVPGGVIGGCLKEGDDITKAQEAARVSVTRCLSALKGKLGSLDCVAQVLSMRCFVNSDSTFQRHPEVMDSASELLLRLLGDRGRHARSSLGVSSIPGGGLTEIEMVVALR